MVRSTRGQGTLCWHGLLSAGFQGSAAGCKPCHTPAATSSTKKLQAQPAPAAPVPVRGAQTLGRAGRRSCLGQDVTPPGSEVCPALASVSLSWAQGRVRLVSRAVWPVRGQQGKAPPLWEQKMGLLASPAGSEDGNLVRRRLWADRGTWHLASSQSQQAFAEPTRGTAPATSRRHVRAYQGGGVRS